MKISVHLSDEIEEMLYEKAVEARMTVSGYARLVICEHLGVEFVPDARRRKNRGEGAKVDPEAQKQVEMANQPGRVVTKANKDTITDGPQKKVRNPRSGDETRALSGQAAVLEAKRRAAEALKEQEEWKAKQEADETAETA